MLPIRSATSVPLAPKTAPRNKLVEESAPDSFVLEGSIPVKSYSDHYRFDERAQLVRQPAPTDLVDRNKARIEAARLEAQPRSSHQPILQIPFDANGKLTGRQLKDYLRDQGYDISQVMGRYFDPSRVPAAISRGTDRDGEKHYDHGSGDCDLAMKEHGLVPCSLNYARTTFVSPLSEYGDDRVFDRDMHALLLYKKDCLFPLDSSVGNLSAGFHLFLTTPHQAQIGVVHDSQKTAGYYAQEFLFSDRRR